jgi:hypothetical protein
MKTAPAVPANKAPGHRFRLVWSVEGYAIYRRTPTWLRLLLGLFKRGGVWYRVTAVGSDVEAWRELESYAAQRGDWHAVGYARANQIMALASEPGDPFKYDPALTSIEGEPAWVNEQYVKHLTQWERAARESEE